MSIPALASAYRLGVNPAWAALNGVGTGAQPIFSRIPSAPVTGGTIADVWPGASLTTPILTRTLPVAGFTLGLVSDSANDAAGQSGALLVTVSYLDTNYTQQTTNIVPTGTAIVTTTITNCLRINSAYVTSAGSGGANAGNIYVIDASTSAPSGIPSTTTKVFDVIPVGYNADGLGMYTVPNGYTALLSHITTGVTNGTATTYEGRVRVGIAIYVGVPGAGTLLPFQWFPIASPGSGTPNDDYRFDMPLEIPAGSEIRFQATSTPLGAEIVVVAELLLATFANTSNSP